METFKINYNSHIRSGWLILLGILICINFPHILLLLYPDQRNEESIWIAVIVFALFALPAIIIHANYYVVNRGDILKYSLQEKEISITHKGLLTTFHLDDICLVEKYESFNHAANRSSVLSWDGYNHSVIHLKNGGIFTITSLLVPDLDLPIEKEKIVVKRNFYRLARVR